MSEKKIDRSISVIRLIAFSFIITCHIQQYLNINLAWWFNVGVQIFLCISGYLYGGRDISDDIMFYKKQLVKILVPYYITVIIVIVIQTFLFPQYIDLSIIVRTILCYGTLAGGEHLWYIPSILMCYIMTPLLLRYLKHNEKIMGNMIIMLGIFFVVFTFFINYFNPAIMSCYFIGLVLGYTENKCYQYEKIKRIIMWFSLMNIIQVILDYFIQIQFDGMLASVYNLWCNYNHVWLGITLFNIIKRILDNIKVPKWIIRVTDWSDKYSYEGYLVHQFMIIGPMSIMALTDNLFLNVLFILVLIMVFSRILNLMEQPVLKFIKGK